MKPIGASAILARAFWVSLCAFACLTPALVLGGDEVLVRGHGVTITTEDVLADAERIPDELRASILGNPERVEQLATNLYVRRVLAKRAQEGRLHNEPRVIALQKLAIDRVLSDAFLAKAIVAAQPVDEKALESLARSAYAAGDGQFLTTEERRVRHILIGKETEGARARAEELLQQLRSGADFATLAKAHSADRGSRARGGDLGLFGRGRMVKSFEDAAFGLAKTGDLAGPVETPFGFHVLRLEEIRPPKKKPFEEVSAEIKRGILSKIAAERSVEIARPIYAENKEVDKAAIESFARQKH